MRVKMLDGAKEVERVALEAKREVDRRLAEVRTRYADKYLFMSGFVKDGRSVAEFVPPLCSTERGHTPFAENGHALLQSQWYRSRVFARREATVISK